MTIRKPGIARLFLFCNERHDGVPEFRQAAMKEMFTARYDQKFRPGFESIHPLNRFLNINEFVFVALHDKPWDTAAANQDQSQID